MPVFGPIGVRGTRPAAPARDLDESCRRAWGRRRWSSRRRRAPHRRIRETPMTYSHLLRFKSLFKEGRALSFPCNAEGLVALETLSERKMTNYLIARAGREYASPSVVPVKHHEAPNHSPDSLGPSRWEIPSLVTSRWWTVIRNDGSGAVAGN